MYHFHEMLPLGSVPVKIDLVLCGQRKPSGVGQRETRQTHFEFVLGQLPNNMFSVHQSWYDGSCGAIGMIKQQSSLGARLAEIINHLAIGVFQVDGLSSVYAFITGNRGKILIAVVYHLHFGEVDVLSLVFKTETVSVRENAGPVTVLVSVSDFLLVMDAVVNHL
jgi:hypothetical protein